MGKGSKLAESGSEWAPTEAQARILETAQEPGQRRTKAVIIKASGVPERTFYRWLSENPGFKQAWDDIWRVALKSQMPGIVAAQVDKALDGDTRAAELLLKLSGLLKEQVDVTTRGGGVVIMLPPEDPPTTEFISVDVTPIALPEPTDG